MMFLSEYMDGNRCARVYRKENGTYTVNFWDANMEIDEWKDYGSEAESDSIAEDWVLRARTF